MYVARYGMGEWWRGEAKNALEAAIFALQDQAPDLAGGLYFEVRRSNETGDIELFGTLCPPEPAPGWSGCEPYRGKQEEVA